MSRCYTDTTWCPKLTGLIIATAYFIAISLVHDSPYVWLSLTLVVIFCLMSFACRSDKPIFRFGNGRRENASQEEDEETPHPQQVWTTDIPPSYSFIMENQSIAPSVILSQPGTPGTPPPSYGSSVFAFPGVTPNVKDKEAPSVASPSMLRQVLGRNIMRSVSRQVSLENALEREESRGISRQNSECDMADDMSGIVIVCKPQKESSSSSQVPTTSPPTGPKPIEECDNE